jgi:hypothetical protein
MDRGAHDADLERRTPARVPLSAIFDAAGRERGARQSLVRRVVPSEGE